MAESVNDIYTTYYVRPNYDNVVSSLREIYVRYISCNLRAVHVLLCCFLVCSFNIKTVLSTYGDFHVKDKTAVRTSYL